MFLSKVLCILLKKKEEEIKKQNIFSIDYLIHTNDNSNENHLGFMASNIKMLQITVCHIRIKRTSEEMLTIENLYSPILRLCTYFAYTNLKMTFYVSFFIMYE